MGSLNQRGSKSSKIADFSPFLKYCKKALLLESEVTPLQVSVAVLLNNFVGAANSMDVRVVFLLTSSSI